MIFRCALFSLMIGLVFGGLNCLCGVIFALIKKLKSRIFPSRTLTAQKQITNHVFDFFFALFVGITYLFAVYTFTDGAFYFISLVALLLGFAFAKYTLLKTFKLLKTTKSENMQNLRSF